MKNYTLVLVFVTMVLFPNNISAQDKLKGNKIVTSETRYVNGFSKIETHDKIEVIITQGMEQSVTVEADENLHVAVYTEVRDSTLIIDLTKRITRKKELRVLVTIDQYIDEIIIVCREFDSYISKTVDYFGFDTTPPVISVEAIPNPVEDPSFAESQRDMIT